jgi:hypothetical protein
MTQIDAEPGDAWSRRNHPHRSEDGQSGPNATSRGSPEGRFVTDSGKALGRHLA